MNPAPLPCGIEQLGDDGLDPFMRIRDHQLHAAQSAAGKLAQECHPERLGFAVTDIHPENLPPAIAVDADGDDHRDGDDAAVLANFHVGGVDPQIGPVALDRTIEEGLHLVVDLGAQSADLGLGDAGHAHGLDQIVDRAGRGRLLAPPP